MSRADALRAQARAERAHADALDAEADAIECDDRSRAVAASDLVSAAAMNVPLRTWRGAIRTGELPAMKVGRAYLARRAHVDAWLDERVVARRQPGPTPTSVRCIGVGDELDRALARKGAA